MKTYFSILSLAALTIAMTACNTQKVADVLNICNKKWAVVKNTDKTHAVIENGALRIYADSLKSDAPISVNQVNVKGDFEATATFEGFNPGTSSALFQLMASTTANPPNVALANVTAASVVVSTVTPAVNDAKGFVNSTQVPLSGTFTIKRTGTKVTITSYVNYATGTQTATITDAVYTDADITIGFQLGTGNNTGPVSVKVTDFKITGGGSLVASDSFDCNSLLN